MAKKRPTTELLVENLFNVDLLNLQAVRNALINFYKGIQKARATAHTDSEPDAVIFSIVQDIIEKFEKEFAVVFGKEKTSYEETERFHALVNAFKLLGKEQDRLDYRRKRQGGDPEYHNNGHNLLVMAVVMVRHMKKWSEQGRQPEAKEITNCLRDLIAAAAHDFGHNGENNRFTGIYMPGRLELRSYKFLEPLLKTANVYEKDREFMKWAIFATDPELPGKISTYVYRKHFPDKARLVPYEEIEKQIGALLDNDRKIVEEFFTSLDSDKELAESAIVIKGSDMVPSFGLGPDFYLRQTALLDKEIVKIAPDKPLLDDNGNIKPDIQLFVMYNFLRVEKICGKLRVGFDDPFLDRLFGNSARHIKEMVENGIPENLKRKSVASSDRRLQLGFPRLGR